MLPTRWGSNPQPPGHQSDAHPTEPPRPARVTWYTAHGFVVELLFLVIFNFYFILFIYLFFISFHLFIFLCATASENIVELQWLEHLLDPVKF